MRTWAALALLSGCYAPHPAPGSPCDPGECPDGLVCDPATHTCQDHAGAVDAAGDWLADYAHRKRVTIRQTDKGAIAGFVVSLVISGDSDLANFAHGGDIAVTADDGTTLLPFELVEFDAGPGDVEAWFRIDLAPVMTHAYLYFDGTPPKTTSSPWDTYAGVWHMAGAVPATDSARGHDGKSPTTDQRPKLTNGAVGDALVFDGVDDTVIVGDPSDGSLDFGTASFSYAAWVNVDTSIGQFDSPIYKGGASATDPGYDFELGTGSWTTHTSDATTTVNPSFGIETDFLGKWTHLVVVIDRGAGKIRTYANGVRVREAAFASGSLDNPRDLAFSRVPADPFHGAIDEVQIVPIALTDAWVAASYANVASRDAFVTLGSLETR